MRKLTNTVWLFMTLALVLTSCSQKYKIVGTTSVTRLDGQMLYLKALVGEEWVNVDSAEVEHGQFRMTGELDSVRMVTLYTLNEGLMPLVLENGTVTVNIAAAQLKASGTPLNDQLYAFIQRRNDFENKLGEIDRREARMVLEGADIDEVHAKLQAEGEQLAKEMNEYVKQFIKDNFTNVLGANVFMMMCSTLPYPVMTPEIEDIMRTAPAAFKDNVLVREYLDTAKENMKLIEEQQRMAQQQQRP